MIIFIIHIINIIVIIHTSTIYIHIIIITTDSSEELVMGVGCLGVDDILALLLEVLIQGITSLILLPHAVHHKHSAQYYQQDYQDDPSYQYCGEVVLVVDM